VIVQLSTLVASPTHGWPPYCGGVQTLSLVRTPSPTVTEQLLHPLHSPHCPSTDVLLEKKLDVERYYSITMLGVCQKQSQKAQRNFIAETIY